MSRIKNNPEDIQEVQSGAIKLSSEKIVPNGKTFPNVDLHRGVIPNEASVEESAHKIWEESDPFPNECLPGTVRDVVTEVSRLERTNPAMAAACALGVLSSCLGQNLRVKSLVEMEASANLYILCAAPSGAGKSSVCARLMKPLSDFESQLQKKWNDQELPRLSAEIELTESEVKRIHRDLLKLKVSAHVGESRQRLIEAKRTLAELKLKLCGPVLVVENATSEAIARVASQNNGFVSSISSDARETINIVMGIYRSGNATDEALLLKSFSGERFRSDRIQRGSISLESIWLNILWFVQWDKLNQLFSKAALSEGGLLPRFLILRIDSLPGAIDRSIDPKGGEATVKWQKLVTDLLAKYRQGKEVTVLQPSLDAITLLDQHHNALLKRQGGDLKQFESFVARWSELAWRMSIVLHAAQWGANASNQEVDVATAQRAITIVDWFGRRQMEILSEYQNTESTTPESRVLALAHASTDGFTATDICRKRIANNAAQAHDLLEQMVADGKLVILTEAKPAGGGHVKIVYGLPNLEPKGEPA